jgi:hypothetical protein
MLVKFTCYREFTYSSDLETDLLRCIVLSVLDCTFTVLTAL